MSEPEQDPLVEALVPDAAVEPPSVTVLRGYVGKSTTAGCWRLYLNRVLDRYVDIPAAEILHTMRLPDDGGTRVWVPRHLKLKYVRTVSAQVQADFLQGPIVRSHRPATGAELAEAIAIERRRRRMTGGGFEVAGICTDIDETIRGCDEAPTMHDWGACAHPV